MIENGLIIIILTVFLFSIVGIIYSRSKEFTLEDYLCSKNRLGLGASVATLFASAMGAWILFSPAETSIIAGSVALFGYAIGSALALAVFAFLGLRLRSLMPKGHTLTEYVFTRFGKGMYALILFVSLFYMAVFLTAELTGISLAAKLVFDIPLYITAILVGAGTLLYTAFGGLKTTIFTDRVQGFFILPLIAIVFIVSLYSVNGVSTVFANVKQLQPQVLDLTYIPGYEFALTLIIAIIGAELFNHGNWQRVYTAKTKSIMKKSFIISGILTVPVIMAAGAFGFFAIGTGTAQSPSVSLFSFLMIGVPKSILITAMVLGIILIMSSMDTLLNGMVSLITIDIKRLDRKLNKKKLLTAARFATVVLALIAIFIAAKGFSVLYLFLIADLVCAACVFPTFYGLYSRKLSGNSSLIACLSGIIAGAYYFPSPNFETGNLLWSFSLAFAVPLALSLLLSLSGKKFDMKKLNQKTIEL